VCQVYKVYLLQVYYRRKKAKQRCAVSSVQSVCVLQVYYRLKKAKQVCAV